MRARPRKCTRRSRQRLPRLLPGGMRLSHGAARVASGPDACGAVNGFGPARNTAGSSHSCEDAVQASCLGASSLRLVAAANAESWRHSVPRVGGLTRPRHPAAHPDLAVSPHAVPPCPPPLISPCLHMRPPPSRAPFLLLQSRQRPFAPAAAFAPASAFTSPAAFPPTSRRGLHSLSPALSVSPEACSLSARLRETSRPTSAPGPGQGARAVLQLCCRGRVGVKAAEPCAPLLTPAAQAAPCQAGSWRQRRQSKRGGQADAPA